MTDAFTLCDEAGLDRLLEQLGKSHIASLENVNLGFNRHHGSGTICVDDIAFVK